MSSVPSFSSFPDIPDAGPSRAAAPTFSSFPELGETSFDSAERRVRKQSPRSSERSFERLEEHRDVHRGSKRDRDDRQDRDRRESDARHKRDKYERRHKHDRSPRRSSKDEEHDRKGLKRRRERELADKLISGEVSASGRESKRHDQVKGVGSWDGNDGRAWYETVTSSRRGRYEEPFDPSSSSAWFNDPVGDKDAVRYGTHSSHSAPRYHRDGSGRVFGLNDGLRIIFSRDRTEKGIEIAPKGRPYIPRYSSRTLDGSASKHLGRLLLRPKDDGPFDPEGSFITFGGPSRRVKEEETVPDYRSIDREENEEDDLRALELTLSGFDTVEQDIRRQTAEMERYLQLHPTDVDAWIRYSTLHLKMSPDLARQAANPSIDPLKLPQNRATAEITLSILSRALEAHPDNFSSISLHIAYIKAAEKFWERGQITRRWQNVLRELGDRATRANDSKLQEGMMDLWLGYIEWQEGEGFGKMDAKAEEAGVDGVIDVYTKCLEDLSAGHLGGTSQGTEENQLYLLLRACVFLRQAGYVERAVAIFQAMMEITFFKPDHLRAPLHAGPSWFEGVLSEFEGFWDDESPRFGENGAPGWRNTDKLDFTSLESTEVIHESEDPHEKWLEAERHAERTLSRPGRAKNFDDDEDSFRVVLFDDIKPFLFPIRTPEVRLHLVYAFLSFIGLPFVPPDVSTSAPGAGDSHLRSALAYNDSARATFWPNRPSVRRIPWQSVQGELMDPEAVPALTHPFGCPVKAWASERQTLFAQTSRWFRELESVDLVHVDITLARNSFDLLRPLVPDPTFTLAYFAFESALSPEGAIEAGKTILSKDRDNLVLWDGYAWLERQKGNIAAARMVYATAMQAASTSDDPNRVEDRRELWASWAEMEFEHDEKRCLDVVLMGAGLAMGQLDSIGKAKYKPATTAPIAMLKARQFYAIHDSPLNLPLLVLAAIFAYLTGGIGACSELIARQLSLLPATSCAAEEAHQLHVKILHIHTRRHATPAALSRLAIENAIKAFPSNTMFLSLYLFGELGNRVYGRVQRLVSQISSNEEGGAVAQLWAVWAEAMSAHRTFWDKGGGGAERVRSALDKGINSTSGRHSVLLWKLYIEFETLMGRHKSAKSLCYRAVAAIGGCKELYLLPFSPNLRPHFATRELREWAQLITERGIRTRIPFEAYFDPSAEEEPALLLPEDEELEEDELRFLTERETLKPY